MNKSHYLSFAACCTDDRFELVRFYPEGNAEARFFRGGHGILYWYCNRHGLFLLSDFNFFLGETAILFFQNRNGFCIILQHFKISLKFFQKNFQKTR